MKLIDILHLVDKDEVPSMKFDSIHTDISEKVMLCFDGDDETFVEVPCTHPILIDWYDCEVYAIEGYDKGIKCWLRYEEAANQKLKGWWERNTSYAFD